MKAKGEGLQHQEWQRSWSDEEELCVRRASRDDVMKQRVEICCVVDGLHSPVGCPQSKAGLCGRVWFLVQ